MDNERDLRDAAERRSTVLIGALVLGAVVLAARSSTLGPFPLKHYQPGVALVAIGLGLLAIRTRSLLKPALIVVVAGLALLAAALSRTAVDRWTVSEETAASFVDVVARLDASGCPVVVTGLDAERAAAVPVVVRWRGIARGSCAPSNVFVVRGPFHSKSAPRNFCAPHAQDSLGSWTLTGVLVTVTRCRGVFAAVEPFVVHNRMM